MELGNKGPSSTLEGALVWKLVTLCYSMGVAVLFAIKYGLAISARVVKAAASSSLSRLTIYPIFPTQIF